MLQNAYLLAKIGADTAENERNVAENLPKIKNYPTGPLPPPARRAPRSPRSAAAGRARGSGPWSVRRVKKKKVTRTTRNVARNTRK